MATDPFGQWMGRQMDDDEVREMLGSSDWGVLSLADGSEPYSIPISFGYADGAVYFAFVRDSPTNAKFEFVDDGATARLLVMDVTAPFEWRSVAATGPVRAVERRDEMGGEGMLPEVDRRPDTGKPGDDWRLLLDALDENAWFSSDYEEADAVASLQGWRLEPEDLTGVELGGRDG